MTSAHLHSDTTTERPAKQAATDDHESTMLSRKGSSMTDVENTIVSKAHHALALLLAAALAGCMSSHEEAVADKLAGWLPNDVSEIDCQAAVAGERECAVSFQFEGTDGLHARVKVEGGAFPEARFKLGHEPRHRAGILLIDEDVWFTTSLPLADHHSESVVSWVKDAARLAITAGEGANAAQIKALREKAKLASSWRN